MKIYARQTPPEWQDSSYLIDNDFYRENIVLIKNPDFPEYGNYVDDFKRAEGNSKYYNWEVVKVLFQLYTGKRWERTTIHGCIQGNWQDCLYCPDVISREDLYAFEVYYFNTGTEFDISIDDPDGEIDSGIYCTSWYPKREIANAYGVKENDVVIYEFTGYKQIPQYKVV